MVESSKILTVSYGTFSCTLEGFDDSFGTMKAIAEYFRDLAADDRYFGAEPPTPDAQMLAKIAEREITRRVEARTEDGAIVLRADAPPAPAMPPISQRPDPVAAAAAAVAPRVVEPVSRLTEGLADIANVDDAAAQGIQQAAAPQTKGTSSTLVASDQPADETTGSSNDMDEGAGTPAPFAHHDAESIAAKLERIRAVVGQTDAVDDTLFEEDHSAALMPQIADHEDHAEIYEELLAAEDANDSKIEPEPALSKDIGTVRGEAMKAEETAVKEADAVTPDQFGAPVDPRMDAYDDTDADAFDEVDGSELSELLEMADAPFAHEDPSKTGSDTAAPDGSNLLDKSVEPAPAPLVLGAEDAVNDDDAAILAALDAELEQTAVAPTEEYEDSVAATVEAIEDLSSHQTSEPVKDAAEAVNAAPAVRATVIRIPKPKAEPKATAEADYTSDKELLDLAQLDGVDDLVVPSGTTASSLSDDGEQELMAELAKLEREYSDVPEQAAQAETTSEVDSVHADDTESKIAAVLSDDDTNDAQAIEPDQPASKRAQLPDPDDATMSHILNQTDEALQEPEGSRRRNAIAHLKAAVLATEAARSLGDKETSVEETEEPFREDLNEVVRPKRPTRPARPAARTVRSRPAPLKLVASQRIDAEGETDVSAKPVQPRRVTAAIPTATQDEASGFAEFAERMGATGLPEMLEAAAAYTAFVEGNEDFSRPQIMEKVKLTVAEEFSREDGLRHFGTLLRNGRISKVRGGRFTVTEETRYRPSA